MFWWPFIVILLSILGLVLSQSGPDLSAPGQMDVRPVYFLVLVAGLVLFAAARTLAHGGRRTMLSAAICLGTIGGLLTAFVFRDEAAIVVDEVRAELMPSAALSRSAGTVELGRGLDGHFRAAAEVNGVPMELMIDTGASIVMLPYKDAASVGLNPKALDFSVPVTTANGQAKIAPVRLSSIRIGSIAVFGVPAAVAQPGKLKRGLLGMSFLDRLDETTFQHNRLILRQGSIAEERLNRALDGRYRARAEINGAPLAMTVDAGSPTVLIPYKKAWSIGFDPRLLDFSMSITTEKGPATAAPVVLSSIRIGSIAVFDVPAAIIQPGVLQDGILGMTFLNRLDETSFRRDQLILRQRVSPRPVAAAGSAN